MSRSQLLRDFLRRDDIEARAGAQVQSLFVQAAVDHLDGFRVADVQRAVNQVNVGLEVGGYAPLADAFGDAGPGALDQRAAAGDVGVEDAPWGVGEVGFDAVGGDVFEEAGDAGEGASSAGGAGESVDFPAGLVPYLRAGGLDVGASVGGVIELVGPDGVV